ncbi:hypothetical protein V6N11_047464 [Hibiscus sabdariffa]|uniref:Uncharacterized protein n=2 Tax=Hibiscus sabdariffa TaxID=183260 RepID=A0ABR2CJ14_9ROSI
MLEEEGFVDMVVSNSQNLQNKRRRVGILGLLRKSKNAIKQWSGNHNWDFNKSIVSLEVQIRDIKCKVTWDSYNTKTAIEVENMNLNFNRLFEDQRALLKSSFTKEEVW